MFLIAALAVQASACSLSAARADYIFDVSVDTSKLSSDLRLTGPFGVDFQLIQGDPAVVNVATIGNINLGGGSAVGNPTLTNSSGDLTGSIALNDSNFFSDFNQRFTPGSTLSFQVDLSMNLGSSPNEFSFALFENYGTSSQQEIPTTDPSGANTLLTGTITSGTSALVTYGGANPNDPITTAATPTPTPGTLILSLLAFGSLAAARGWKRLRRATADPGE